MGKQKTYTDPFEKLNTIIDARISKQKEADTKNKESVKSKPRGFWDEYSPVSDKAVDVPVLAEEKEFQEPIPGKVIKEEVLSPQADQKWIYDVTDTAVQEPRTNQFQGVLKDTMPKSQDTLARLRQGIIEPGDLPEQKEPRQPYEPSERIKQRNLGLRNLENDVLKLNKLFGSVDRTNEKEVNDYNKLVLDYENKLDAHKKENPEFWFAVENPDIAAYSSQELKGLDSSRLKTPDLVEFDSKRVKTPTGYVRVGDGKPISNEQRAYNNAVLIQAMHQGKPVTQVEKDMKITGTPLGRIGASIVQGAAIIPQGIAGMMEYAGDRLGIDSIKEYAKQEGDNISNWIQEIAPDKPNFVEQLGSGLGSMLVFMPFGIGAMSLSRALATVSPKIAAWYGVGASTVLEAMTEAGIVYQESHDPEAAEITFLANIAVIGLTNRYGIFSEKYKTALQKAFFSAGLEGAQEFSQEIIQDASQGKQPDYANALTAMIIGAILGAGASTTIPIERAKLQEELSGIVEEGLQKGTLDIESIDQIVRAELSPKREEQILDQEKKQIDLSSQLPQTEIGIKEAGLPEGQALIADQKSLLENEELQTINEKGEIVPLKPATVENAMARIENEKKRIEEEKKKAEIDKQKEIEAKKEAKKIDRENADVFTELNRQFQHAKRKNQLFDEREIAKANKLPKDEKWTERFEKLYTEALEHNKNLNEKNKLTLENVAKKKYGKSDLNLLTEKQQKDVLFEFNEAKKQGKNTISELEIITPKIKDKVDVKPEPEIIPEPEIVEEEITQEQLEQQYDDLKKKRDSLRDEDGSVSKENLEEWNKLGEEVDEALRRKQRGDNKQPISIRSIPKSKEENPKVLVGDDVKLAEAQIEEIISTSKTVDEAFDRIRSAGYAFTSGDNRKLANYLDDRINNRPTVGNNKAPFAEWRKGTPEIVESAEGGTNDQSGKRGTLNVGEYRTDFTEDKVIKGKKAKIAMPDGTKRSAEYAVVELDDIIQSHDPESFQPLEGYPTEKGEIVNDRNYQTDKNSQLDVIDKAKKLDPDQLISNAVEPAVGLPIITKEGIVVSGNGRTMMIKRAFKHHPENYNAYKEKLLEDALAYGLTEDQIKNMKNPVLVKIDYDIPRYSKSELAKYNKQVGKGEKLVDKIKKVGSILNDPKNQKAFEAVFAELDQYETMSEFYNKLGSQKVVRDALLTTNVILPHEASTYFNENGSFTKEGKNLFESGLIGSVFSEKTINTLYEERIGDLRENVILKSIPSLIKNKGLGEYNLIKDIEEALNLEVKFRNTPFRTQEKNGFRDFLRQGNLLDKLPIWDSIVLNRLINSGGRNFGAVLTKYNFNANAQLEEGGMFGEEQTKFTPDEIFDKIVQENLKEKDGKEIAELKEIYDALRESEQRTPPGDEGSGKDIRRDQKEEGEQGEKPNKPISEDRKNDAIERLKKKYKKPPSDEPPAAKASRTKIEGLEESGSEPNIPIEELKDLVTVGASIYQDGITKKAEWKKAFIDLVGQIGNNKLEKVYNLVEIRYGQEIKNVEEFETGESATDIAGADVSGVSGRAGTQPGERPGIVIVNGENIPKPKSYVDPKRYNDWADEHQILATDLALTQLFDKKGKAFLLADGTGVGKTGSMILIANEYHSRTNKPVLILTTSEGVIRNNFTHDAKAMGVNLKDFHITTYSQLVAGKVPQQKWGLVIFDESQKLKNLTSERAQLSGVIQSDHRIYASATPTDKPTGASYFFHEITGRNENEIANELGYTIEYEWRTDPDTGERKQYKVTHLLEGFTWERVLDNIARFRDEAIKNGAMIRREYPYFGEVKFYNHNLGGDHARRQDEVFWWFQDKIDKSWQRKWKNHYSKERTQSLVRLTEPYKVNKIYDLMKKDLAEGKTVIVFAQFESDTFVKGTGDEVGYTKGGNEYQKHSFSSFIGLFAKKLEADGIEFAKLYGKDPKRKAAEVRKFQEGGYKVALATPKSAGEGINLDDQIGDRPTVVYLASLDFAGDVYEQVLGRVSRRNTKSPAQVKAILSINAISDQKMYNSLKRKMQTLRRIQSGEDPDKAIGIDIDSDLTGAIGDAEIRAKREKFGVDDTFSKYGDEVKLYAEPFFSKLQKVLDAKLPLTESMKQSVLYEGQPMFSPSESLDAERSDLAKLKDYKKHLELSIDQIEKKYDNDFEAKRIKKLDYSKTRAVNDLKDKYNLYGDKQGLQLIGAYQELYKTNKLINELQSKVESVATENQTNIFGDPEIKKPEPPKKRVVETKPEQLGLFSGKENIFKRTYKDLKQKFNNQEVKTQNKISKELENSTIRYAPEKEFGVILPKRLVPNEWRKTHKINLTGSKLSADPQQQIIDIADMHYVSRDPKTETMFFVGIDGNGTVVGHLVYSSNAANYVLVEQKSLKEIANELKDRGATRIIGLHNHPSGDPQPSDADLEAAIISKEIMKREGANLDEYVVINGDYFTHWSIPEIGVKQIPAMKAKETKVEYTSGKKESYYSEILEEKYNNPAKHPESKWYKEFDTFKDRIQLKDPVDIVKLTAQLKYGDGVAALVIVDARLTIRGYEYFPSNILQDENTFKKYFEEQLKSYGGDQFFIVGTESDLRIDKESLEQNYNVPFFYDAKERPVLKSEYATDPYVATVAINDRKDAGIVVIQYSKAEKEKSSTRPAVRMASGKEKMGAEKKPFKEFDEREKLLNAIYSNKKQPPVHPKVKQDAMNHGSPSAMSRSINRLTQAKQARAGKDPFILTDKIKKVLEHFGVPIHEKHLSKRYLGVFKHQTEGVRVQRIYDIVVVAHEVTHALDFKHKLIENLINTTQQGDPIRRQLTDIYVDFYPRAKREHPLERRMKEGLATLFEYYFYDPQGIQQNYPDLVKEFIDPSGKYYQQDFTDMLKMMNDVVDDYAALDPWHRIGARIRRGKEIVKTRDSGFTLEQRLKFELFNLSEPFERYAKVAGVRRSWDDPSVSYFNYLNRSTIAYNWIMGDSSPILKSDGNWEFRKETVQDYLKLVKDRDLEFDEYLVARRNLTLYNRVQDLKQRFNDVFTDLQNAVNNNDIQAIQDLANHPAVVEAQELERILKNDDFDLQDMQATVNEFQDEFEDAVKIFDKINDNLVDFSENTGLISSETAELWKSREGYASFQRYINDELLENFNRVSSNAQTNLKAKKKRTGGQLDIISPTYNQMMAINETVGKGLNNMMWSKMLKLSTTNKDIGRRFEIIETQVVMVNGKPTFPQEKDPKLIRILVNGKRVFVRPAPEFALLNEALRPSEMDTFAKIVMMPSQIFTRLTTSANPMFAFTNIMIDQVTLGYNTKHGSIPGASPIVKIDKLGEHFVKWVNGIGWVKGEKKSATGLNEYLLLGGQRQTFASEYGLAPEDLIKTIAEDQTRGEKVVGVIDSAIGLLEIPSNYSEYASRYSEYSNAIKDGLSMSEAMYAAAQATLPFQQRGRFGGKFGRQVVKSIPYFNPGLQALYRFMKAAKETPIRFATISAGLLTIAITSAIYAMVYGDDDDRRLMGNLTPEELSRALYIKNPFGKGLIRIRIPEQIGGLTGVAYLYVIQHYGGNEAVFGDYLETINSVVPRQFGILEPDEMIASWMPQIIKPGVETAFNRRTYPDLMPIEPAWMEDQYRPEDRYTDYTSYIAKELGKWAGLSPIKIDYYVKAQLGVIGGLTMGVGDFVQGDFKRLQRNNPAIKTEDAFPFMGRAYNNFYDRKEFYTHTYNKLKKEHSYSDAEADRIKDYYKTYNDMAKQLTNIRALYKEEEEVPKETRLLLWGAILALEDDNLNLAKNKIEILGERIPDKERKEAKYQSGEPVGGGSGFRTPTNRSR